MLQIGKNTPITNQPPVTDIVPRAARTRYHLTCFGHFSMLPVIAYFILLILSTCVSTNKPLSRCDMKWD
jgi:hypothetical protein